MDLPAEVWQYILGWLAPERFWPVRLVCISWYGLVWSLLRKVHLHTCEAMVAQECLRRGCQRVHFSGDLDSGWEQLVGLWKLSLFATAEKNCFSPTEALSTRHLRLRNLCVSQLPGVYRSIYFRGCPKIPRSLRGHGKKGYVRIDGEASYLEISHFARLTVVVESEMLWSKLQICSCPEVFIVGYAQIGVILRLTGVHSLMLRGDVAINGNLEAEELICHNFPVAAGYTLKVRKFVCSNMEAHHWERIVPDTLEEVSVAASRLITARGHFPQVHTVTINFSEPLPSNFSRVFPRARLVVSKYLLVATPHWAY